jgi:diketogulonate reductase-like aldo/keto reductase
VQVNIKFQIIKKKKKDVQFGLQMLRLLLAACALGAAQASLMKNSSPRAAQVSHFVELKNAAQPNTMYPAVGMGTGCNIGGCNAAAPQPMAALNMSLLWLSLGGRRFDGADSYGIEPGIGEAIKQSKVPRKDVFIVSKTGPGGLAWPLGYNETIQQVHEIVANYSTTYVDLMLVHW